MLSFSLAHILCYHLCYHLMLSFFVIISPLFSFSWKRDTLPGSVGWPPTLDVLSLSSFIHDSNGVTYIIVPWLLFFVLHYLSGHHVLALLYKNYAEKYGEEDDPILKTWCQKILEEREKYCSSHLRVWRRDKMAPGGSNLPSIFL